MAETTLTHTETRQGVPLTGWRSFVTDWRSDQRAFKGVSWG